jgi:hypothetical protein
VVGGFGADTATIRASGAAVISYDPLSVGKEGTPRNNSRRVARLVDAPADRRPGHDHSHDADHADDPGGRLHGGG